MQPQINDLVYPVLSYGLALKERLDKGEALDLAAEQGRLIGLLQADAEARRVPDYGGDGPFLGIRYALVCWLDEVFIMGTTWGGRWNEGKLETALYGTNARAVAFWNQAKLARVRPSGDAQEVFFLCVMLGFRGAAREDLPGLKAWVEEAKAQLSRGAGAEWPAPPRGSAPVEVRPLHGRDRLRRMLVVGGVAALSIAVLTIAYVIINSAQA